jgi:hypothetical protein
MLVRFNQVEMAHGLDVPGGNLRLSVIYRNRFRIRVMQPLRGNFADFPFRFCQPQLILFSLTCSRPFCVVLVACGLAAQIQVWPGVVRLFEPDAQEHTPVAAAHAHKTE